MGKKSDAKNPLLMTPALVAVIDRCIAKSKPMVVVLPPRA